MILLSLILLKITKMDIIVDNSNRIPTFTKGNVHLAFRRVIDKVLQSIFQQYVEFVIQTHKTINIVGVPATLEKLIDEKFGIEGTEVKTITEDNIRYLFYFNENENLYIFYESENQANLYIRKINEIGSTIVNFIVEVPGLDELNYDEVFKTVLYYRIASKNFLIINKL